MHSKRKVDPVMEKYMVLRVKIDELLENERKKNDFFSQFVPEWKRILI